MNSYQFFYAVTIIGGLTGLGIFLDQILTTQEARDKVHAFLQAKSKVPSSKAFFSYLSLVYEAVFMRFYGEKVFSARYVFSCLVTSVMSVVVIFAVQIYLFGPSWDAVINLDSLQVNIIIACVMANAFIDWLTIGQTQTFFSIAISQRSVGRAVLLIVSDIIVTTNLFILLYSAVIGMVVIFGRPLFEGRVTVEAEILQADAALKELPDGWRNAFGTKDSDGVMRQTLALELTTAPLRSQKAVLRAYVSHDTITVADLLQVSGEFEARPEGKAGIRFRHPEAGEDPTSDTVNRKEEKLADLVMDERGSKAWKEASGNANLTEWQTVTVDLRESKADLALDPLYTAAFVYAELLEMNFPHSVLGPISTVPVDGVLARYQVYRPDPSYVFGCFAKGAWRVVESLSEPCDKAVAVETGGMRLVSLAAKRLLEKSKPQIPLNTLFLSSIAITLVVYLYAIFLLISRVVSWVFVGGAVKTERYFLKSPFACIGFVAGVFAVLYYVYVVGSF